MVGEPVDRSATAAPELPGLVPELLVTELDQSLAFWCGLIGFDVLYDRLEERFAMLKLGSAAVMLEERQPGTRQWLTGDLTLPLGRGLNMQIAVPAAQPILDRLAAARWPLFMACEEKWYGAGAVELGVRQFLVQDPDGYLLRPAESLGTQMRRG